MEIKLKSNLKLYLLLVLINLFSFGYIFVFGGYFFRDYSIIFEGGLRVWDGQIPYKDFFLPVGPVVLYLQAFFNWICGANATAMHLHVSCINSIVLTCFFLYARKHIGNLLSVGLTFFLHFCFYGATVNPWYNHTAIFFYIIPQIILLYEFDKSFEISLVMLLVVGGLASLSLFSKQDIGALGIVFIGSQILFFSQHRWKNSSIFIISVVIATSAIVFYYSIQGDFGYWFNYGQFPHSSRVDKLLGLINPILLAQDLRLHLMIGASFYFILLGDFRKISWFTIYMIIGLSGFSLIVFYTSGQPKWTAYFSMPLAGMFLIRMLSQNETLDFSIKQKRIVNYIVFWVLFAYFYLIVHVNSHPMSSYFDKSFQKLTNSSYAGMRFKPEIIKGIEKIKLELGGYKPTKNEDWLLNMSSYSFLYSDFGITPPPGTHLWYHSNVTLFEKDYLLFLEKLQEKPFEYILLQEMASGTPPPEFRDFLVSIGYSALFSVPTPKSGRGSRYDLTVYRLIKE